MNAPAASAIRTPCARLAAVLLVLLAATPRADESWPPIFDAHIHYNQDLWSALTPERALALMREAGISGALVSSTPTEGTERLYRAAPERVVPFLRPYPSAAHRHTWFRDPLVIGYVREHLGRVPYRGLGEFHLPGGEAHGEVVTALVALARERGLALHAHTDLEGLRALLVLAPDIPVIWAHGGFDVPESVLRELLDAHPRLLLELSLREGITRQGRLTPVWRGLFIDFTDRFLIGMDTYSPRRWLELPQLAAEARGWLGELPRAQAEQIAHRNASRLFAPSQRPRRPPASTPRGKSGDQI